MKWKGTTGTASVELDEKSITVHIGESSEDYDDDNGNYIDPSICGIFIPKSDPNREHSEHDAQLFANAINTIQKCDLMPSELLEWYNEAMEVIRGIDADYTFNSIIELLEKHES